MFRVQGTPWKQPVTHPTLFIRILNQLCLVLPTTRSNKDFSHLVEGQHITAPCHSSVGLSSSLSSGKRCAASAHCTSATTAALHLQAQVPSFSHCRFFASTCHPSAPQRTDSDLSLTAGLLLHVHKCAYIHYLSTFIIT